MSHDISIKRSIRQLIEEYEPLAGAGLTTVVTPPDIPFSTRNVVYSREVRSVVLDGVFSAGRRKRINVGSESN